MKKPHGYSLYTTKIETRKGENMQVVVRLPILVFVWLTVEVVVQLTAEHTAAVAMAEGRRSRWSGGVPIGEGSSDC